MIYSYQEFVTLLYAYRALKQESNSIANVLEEKRTHLLEILYSDSVLSCLMGLYPPYPNWIGDLFISDKQSVHFPMHSLLRQFSQDVLWVQSKDVSYAKTDLIAKMHNILLDVCFNKNNSYSHDAIVQFPLRMISEASSLSLSEMKDFFNNNISLIMLSSQGEVLSFFSAFINATDINKKNKKKISKALKKTFTQWQTDQIIVYFQTIKNYIHFVFNQQLSIDTTISEDYFLLLFSKMLYWIDYLSPGAENYRILFIEELNNNRLTYQNESTPFLRNVPDIGESSGCLEGLVEKMLDLHLLGEEEKKEFQTSSESSHHALSLSGLQKKYIEALTQPYLTSGLQPTPFFRAILRATLLKKNFNLEKRYESYRKIPQRQEALYQEGLIYIDRLVAQCASQDQDAVEPLVELEEILDYVEKRKLELDREISINKKRLMCFQDSLFFNPDTLRTHEHLHLFIKQWLLSLKEKVWIPGEFHQASVEMIRKYSPSLLLSLERFASIHTHCFYDINHPNQDALFLQDDFWDGLWQDFRLFLSDQTSSSHSIESFNSQYYYEFLRSIIPDSFLKEMVISLSDYPVEIEESDIHMLLLKKQEFFKNIFHIQYKICEHYRYKESAVPHYLYLIDKKTVDYHQRMLDDFYCQLLMIPDLKKEFESNPYTFFNLESVWQMLDHLSHAESYDQTSYLYYVFFRHSIQTPSHRYLITQFAQKKPSFFKIFLFNDVMSHIAAHMVAPFQPLIYLAYLTKDQGLIDSLLQACPFLVNQSFLIKRCSEQRRGLREEVLVAVPPLCYAVESGHFFLFDFYLNHHASVLPTLDTDSFKTNHKTIYHYIFENNRSFSFKLDCINRLLSHANLDLNSMIFYAMDSANSSQESFQVPVYHFIAKHIYDHYTSLAPLVSDVKTKQIIKKILTSPSLKRGIELFVSDHCVFDFFEHTCMHFKDREILDLALQQGFSWEGHVLYSNTIIGIALSGDSPEIYQYMKNTVLTSSRKADIVLSFQGFIKMHFKIWMPYNWYAKLFFDFLEKEIPAVRYDIISIPFMSNLLLDYLQYQLTYTFDYSTLSPKECQGLWSFFEPYFRVCWDDVSAHQPVKNLLNGSMTDRTIPLVILFVRKILDVAAVSPDGATLFVRDFAEIFKKHYASLSPRSIKTFADSTLDLIHRAHGLGRDKKNNTVSLMMRILRDSQKLQQADCSKPILFSEGSGSSYKNKNKKRI